MEAQINADENNNNQTLNSLTDFSLYILLLSFAVSDKIP